jgi:hypothetical protein
MLITAAGMGKGLCCITNRLLWERYCRDYCR